MSRFTLALGCFFKLLFAGRLPARAVEYLPAGSKPLPEPTPPNKPVVETSEVVKQAQTPPPAAASKPKQTVAQHHKDGSLAMLALLQREGRLIDFLQEDIADYEDADIGAAVRDIHRGCKKVLDSHFTLEAVMPGEEDDEVKIHEGFEPAEIKLLGEVAGPPPFTGTLRHHGWRATECKLPKLMADVDRRILAAAQVEVK